MRFSRSHTETRMAKTDTSVASMTDIPDLVDWLCARIIEFIEDDKMDVDKLQEQMRESFERAHQMGGEEARQKFEEEFGDPTKKLQRLFVALK